MNELTGLSELNTIIINKIEDIKNKYMSFYCNCNCEYNCDCNTVCQCNVQVQFIKNIKNQVNFATWF